MGWADPSARPAFQAAMQVIREVGAQVVEVKLPDFPYGPLADIVIGAEEASVFETLILAGQVDQLADPSQAANLKANLAIPATEYLKAMRIRTLLKQEFRKLFAQVDLLVAPSRYDFAPKITEPLDGPDPVPSPVPATPGMKDLIQAGNLAAIPALSLPCGFANGMPVALQLAGPAFTENTLIAVGKEFQSRTDWHKRRPPVVS
jgi:aspartyl-tRNA(Asn)/glutamyl-tRNA(Gln) amidotransferase subunit A